MKPVLEIKGISKKFAINEGQTSYLNIRDSISGIFKSANKKKEFWALKDISFDIQQGDTVGIIGKNGAGKSTLLKILSKITPPTSGKIIGNGRIASLLEVGTGFHSELTGRENVFMNGSILGMRKREIQRNFDSIVDFAGVEKFIDTPLKHYSSGMQLRLAFAVAAFLENEILIIDEVLAVGDIEFQKKCMGKMNDVSNSGRTILFVSHNMGAISQLCKKSILLKEGSLIDYSKTTQIIDNYLKADQVSQLDLDRREREEWACKNQFIYFSMTNAKNEVVNEFRHDEELNLNIDLFLPEYNESLELAISLYDRLKNRVFTIHEKVADYYLASTKIARIKIKLPESFITPGNFSWLMCILHKGINLQDIQDDIYGFNVTDNGSAFTNYSAGSYGSVFAKYKIEKR